MRALAEELGPLAAAKQTRADTSLTEREREIGFQILIGLER